MLLTSHERRKSAVDVVARDGHIGSKSGPANSVAIFTHRYQEMPLVISGPGAGPEIKAAGVMEDMLQLANICRTKSTPQVV